MDFGGIGVFRRFFLMLVLGAGCLVLANCAGGLSGKVDSKYGVSSSARIVEPGGPVPKGGGVYHVGKPYVVAGRTYVPAFTPNYSVIGLSSWYGDDFHGRRTANGEIFDENAISAAHPTLPLPSYARVTNLDNHKSILVRVNDRGPFVGNRIIDLSRKAAQMLGFYGQGLTKVKVDYVGPAPLTGSDERTLIQSLRQDTPAEARVQTASNVTFTSRSVDSRDIGGKPARVRHDNPADTPANATSLMTPVSAYAAPHSDAGTNVLTSGRGLY